MFSGVPLNIKKKNKKCDTCIFIYKAVIRLRNSIVNQFFHVFYARTRVSSACIYSSIIQILCNNSSNILHQAINKFGGSVFIVLNNNSVISYRATHYILSLHMKWLICDGSSRRIQWTTINIVSVVFSSSKCVCVCLNKQSEAYALFWNECQIVQT